MKNIFHTMFATAGVLFLVSCSQEDMNHQSSLDNSVEAKFKISALDGIVTRAIGDGTSVTEVACAVFDADGNEMDLRQYIPITNKTAEYTIRLVKGQEYRIVFFAHKKEAGHYNVDDMKNIQINEAASNLEGRDAFTNYVDISAERSMFAVDTTVYLERPFAQLNIGSTDEDIEAARKVGTIVTQTQVKVSNVYTAFNAYENGVSGDPEEVTFALSVVPTEKLKVEGDEYAYHALNYLLVGDKNTERSLTDVEFVWQSAAGKTNNPTTVFKNIPVQRNYRTNIIGTILTDPAEFNVIVSPEFEKPDYNLGIAEFIYDENKTSVENGTALYNAIMALPDHGVMKLREGVYKLTKEQTAEFTNKSFTLIGDGEDDKVVLLGSAYGLMLDAEEPGHSVNLQNLKVYGNAGPGIYAKNYITVNLTNVVCESANSPESILLDSSNPINGVFHEARTIVNANKVTLGKDEVVALKANPSTTYPSADPAVSYAEVNYVNCTLTCRANAAARSTGSNLFVNGVALPAYE